MKKFSDEAIMVAMSVVRSHYGQDVSEDVVTQALQAALDTDNVKGEVFKALLDEDDEFDQVMLQQIEEQDAETVEDGACYWCDGAGCGACQADPFTEQENGDHR